MNLQVFNKIIMTCSVEFTIAPYGATASLAYAAYVFSFVLFAEVELNYKSSYSCHLSSIVCYVCQEDHV